MFLTAEEDLALGDGGFGGDAFTQAVFGEQLELRAGFDHGYHALAVGEVNLAVAGNRGRFMVAAQAFVPDLGPRGGIQADANARAVVHEVAPASVTNRRRDE